MAVRVGFIGCGPRGTAMAQAYQAIEGVELVAACDIDEGRLAAFCERFHITHRYTDYTKMLAQEVLDIVHLATQPTLRVEPIIAAAEAKVKVILSEKPIALSLPELDEMLTACQRNGSRLVINHQLRYQSVWRRLHSALTHRELGEVTFLHAHCRMNALEQGTHLVDLVLWLLGEQMPAWVMGDSWGESDFAKTHSAPDNLVGVLVFADGLRCLVEMGPSAPALSDDDRMSMHFGIRVMGTEGWAQAWLARWQLVKRAEQQTQLRLPYDEDNFAAQFAFQRDLVRAATEPDFVHPCDAQSGRASLEIIEALCLSALEGKRIPLPLPSGISGLATMRKRALGH
jgi:predicted dehydrogenase